MITILAAAPQPSWAGIITAVSTLVLALGGAFTAFGVLLPILRRTKDTQKSIVEVHTIVNQQRTDLQNYNRALVAALHKAGVEIPVDQSIPPDPEVS